MKPVCSLALRSIPGPSCSSVLPRCLSWLVASHGPPARVSLGYRVMPCVLCGVVIGLGSYMAMFRSGFLLLNHLCHTTRTLCEVLLGLVAWNPCLPCASVRVEALSTLNPSPLSPELSSSKGPKPSTRYSPLQSPSLSHALSDGGRPRVGLLEP